MALNFLKKRWQKITFTIVLVLTAVILIAAFFINRYWSPILADKLKSTVLKSSDGLYHIKFDDAQLHVLQGKIVLYNITLDPDTAVYEQKKRAHSAPEKLYTLRVKKLVLKHIHPLRLYFKHQLNIGQIVLSGPELNIAYHPNRDKDTTHKDNRTLYQKISKSLKMIHVGQIMLSDVKLKYEDYTNAKPTVNKLKDLDLGATDLLIDSATQFDKSRFMYCRDMTVELRNYSGVSSKGLYRFQAKTLKFSTLTHQLNAYGFVLHATEAPLNFFQKTYKDRFNTYMDTLQLNDFDYELFDKYHTIRASCLTLSKGGINVFSNPRTDPKSFSIDKSITFPNKAIHMIPVNIKLDTIRLKNFNVTYEEYNLKTKRSGHVSFNDINGHFYNVTNNPEALQKNNYCYVQMNAKFMGRASIKANFTFNLTDSLYSYSYRGSIGPMNMPAVNAATVPLASIAIKSGQVIRADFDIQANRYINKGKITFLYNNLKIQLLKADTTQQKMHNMALASLFANNIILKRNNPDNPGDVPRSANVVYKRPLYYPFFRTIWNTLLLGIKPCAGLDQKAQEKATAKMAEHEKNKALKKLKKEAKKKQKEDKKRLKKLTKAREKARKKAEKQQKKAEKEAKNQNAE